MSRLDAIVGMLDGIERALDAGEYDKLSSLSGIPDDDLPVGTSRAELEVLADRLAVVQQRLEDTMDRVEDEIAAGPGHRKAARAYISSGYHGS